MNSLSGVSILSKKSIFAVLLMILAVFVPSLTKAEVLIIVNAKSPLKQISSEDVMNIFLGKKLTWEDEKSTEVKFVLMPEAECHEEFVKKFTKKSAAQFKRYWNNMVFTGKGMMPKSINSAEEMIRFVSETDGAIGYVAPGAPLDGVAVMDIVD
jgi:ABC-type phosphate transport system substrate-binding protein